MATRSARENVNTPRLARVLIAALLRRPSAVLCSVLALLALDAGTAPAAIAAARSAKPHAQPVAVPLVGDPQLRLPVGPARALTGAAALAVLNEQRRLNGIPPLSIDRVPFASHWCPNEDQGP